MALAVHALEFDSPDPAVPAAFWAALLGRDVVADGAGLLLPGTTGQVTLRFGAEDTAKVGPNPLHLHLNSDDVPPPDTVATALALGATLLDLGNPADADFEVLADPDGNEFCVLDGGNSWVTGCGFLGEVACDGSRAVGLFWSGVLGWPLVWDQGAETAVQAPVGGTKISWGGEDPPVHPRVSRQRFALTVPRTDLGSELARLESLGAIAIDAPDGPTRWLRDPDGTMFALSVG